MARTLKVFSALLSYPNEDLRQAAPALADVIEEERLVPEDHRVALLALIDDLAKGDIYDLQERYVLLFDRTRSLSLHLFEHVHGESRDRGQAMVDLMALYQDNGLEIQASELPDFLPLFLEFLSTRPIEQVRELLGQTAHILSALSERLEKRQSVYVVVFRALVEIAATSSAATDSITEEEDEDPLDLEALDAAWEDEPVTFGPDAASSCRDGLVARLRAAKRPAPAARST